MPESPSRPVGRPENEQAVDASISRPHQQHHHHHHHHSQDKTPRHALARFGVRSPRRLAQGVEARGKARQGRAVQGRAGQGMEGKELHSPQWHTMNLARESSYTLAERGKTRGEEGRTQGRAG